MTNEAPPPDEVEKAVTAFNFCISCIKDGCLWSTGSLDKPHITTKNLKDVMARIAALEAENKRLIDVLKDLVEIDRRDSTSDPDLIATDRHREETWGKAKSAIAQTGKK